MLWWISRFRPAWIRIRAGSLQTTIGDKAARRYTRKQHTRSSNPSNSRNSQEPAPHRTCISLHPKPKPAPLIISQLPAKQDKQKLSLFPLTPSQNNPSTKTYRTTSSPRSPFFVHSPNPPFPPPYLSPSSSPSSLIYPVAHKKKIHTHTKKY